MENQTIIYLLVALGFAGTIMTQLRRRTTSVQVWLFENKWGIVSGLIGAATLVLIGPGDNVDLGSYVARTWAVGIGTASAYLLGGNVPSGSADTRRFTARKG